MKNKFPNIEEYEDKLIDTCDRINGFAFLSIDSSKYFDYITHWVPRYDEDFYFANITLDTPYRLFDDRYGEEPLVIDNSGQAGLLYLAHEGDFILMKGCKRWKDYIKLKWTEDYSKSEDYKTVMKSTMEHKRIAEIEIER